MNANTQNAAIARICGWTFLKEFYGNAPDATWSAWKTNNVEECGRTHRLPDFCQDLNAMHMAELVLEPKSPSDLDIPDRMKIYRCTLEALCVGHFGGPLRANAGQRAEALLRTLDLWEAGRPSARCG